jgi:hypothetical protein
MSDNAANLVEQLHRAAVERYQTQKQHELALFQQVHLAAMEQFRAEQQRLDDLIDQLHHAAATQAGQAPATPLPGPTVPFTELPAALPASPLYREWNTYRREAGRLLAQGGEGRHVLIQAEQIIGLWDTHDAAMTAGYQRFAGQPFLVHQVEERERVLRCVTTHQCPNLHLPYRRAS